MTHGDLGIPQSMNPATESCLNPGSHQSRGPQSLSFHSPHKCGRTPTPSSWLPSGTFKNTAIANGLLIDDVPIKNIKKLCFSIANPLLCYWRLTSCECRSNPGKSWTSFPGWAQFHIVSKPSGASVVDSPGCPGFTQVMG